MKKTILITIGSLFVCIAISFYAFDFSGKDSVEVEESNGPKGGKIIEIDEVRTKTIEEEFPMNLSEISVQDAIHGMSHQKIRAKDKWGFIPLTAERVERLTAVVESNINVYKHANVYYDILSRWSKNDFSMVDEDHNAIWEMQNGNIGKATGILSVEQEREFIEKHFEIVNQ
ncbi:DUF6241 domain-containing protein [Peribacillus frigoritolerans]|uniref:DUF6241 domain-containing protein n=1 Tax=Peribacillus frigoritolerans TaxID=450367 RepID=UPI00105AA231|nr:DUF6241 domain-containing protein [Peribacillus frigoritolerans]TDL80958.1 hypothetical protein E2R53_13370 [Peribacillus frigoritolerans]